MNHVCNKKFVVMEKTNLEKAPGRGLMVNEVIEWQISRGIS